MRSDGRLDEQLRPTRITPNYLMHAEGSVLVESGKTKVICTASVEDRVPPFRRNSGKGWVTAEYGMLPRATTTRTQREASAGRIGGRTQEIQRLIGRSLRAVTDLTTGTFNYADQQDSYPVPTTANGFSLHTGDWTMTS